MTKKLIVLFVVFLVDLPTSWCQSTPDSERATHEDSVEACRYNQLYSYSNIDTMAMQLIAKISSLVYIKPHFSVLPCPKILTCRALIYDDMRRYIFYDPNFIHQILTKNGNDWGLIAILAHEVAHHLDGHTLRYADLDQHRRDELEADEFSGAILAKMGADAEQAILGLNSVGHPSCENQSDGPYPCFESRKAAVLTGFRLVIPDEVKRDFLLNKSLDKVDISTFDNSIVRDQGKELTAAAFSVAYAMEYEYRRQFGDSITLSPRYIYNRSRSLLGPGLTLGQAMATMRRVGAIEERHWPYIPYDYDSAKLKAANRITKRVFVDSIIQVSNNPNELIKLLQQGRVILISIRITNNFFSPDFAVIKVDTSESLTKGSLAACLVGYDNINKLFKIRGSLGINWGQSGYGYVSVGDFEKIVKYAYILTVSRHKPHMKKSRSRELE
jgi:hypothetical protein